MTPCHDTEKDQEPSVFPLVGRRRFLALPVAAAPWMWAGMTSGSPSTSATTVRSAFFSRPGASDLGFYVLDGPGGRFLSGFEALGGLPIVGRPIGRTYMDPEDGSVRQPFERMLLRWNQETKQVEPVALLDVLSARGLDNELRTRHGIPALSRNVPPIPRGYAQIYAFYTSYGGAETFGYARSTPQPVDQGVGHRAAGPSVGQRFQNAALQYTRPGYYEVPSGSIVRPLAVGTWAGELGFYPGEALLPEVLRFARFEAPIVVRHGDSAGPLLYLTLDDCWTPEPVAQALDIAAATGAKLTFFPVGACLKKAPQLWRRAVANGHAVENHTHTHRKLSELSDAEVRWEIETQRETLDEVLGYRYRQHFLRPPLGDGILNYQARIPLIAQQLGFKIAMWSRDSAGYVFGQRTDRWAVDQVRAALEPYLVAGAVVLQHSLPAEVAALPHLIEAAEDRGLLCMSMPTGIV